MASSGLSWSISRLRLLKSFGTSANHVIAPLKMSTKATGQHTEMIELMRTQNMDDPMLEQTSSKAAQSYLRRVKAHEAFMAQKVTEFDIGRRHLANMMGVDPSTFTQKDIDAAISYLLPSGLFEPHARPKMLPPDQVFRSQKEAQFDMSGRPYDPLFYTLRPRFYQVMHDLAGHMIELDKHENMMLQKASQVEVIDKLNIEGSKWFTKDQLERHLMERIKDEMYEKFILAQERLCCHPYSHRVKDFVMQFRKTIKLVTLLNEVPEVQYDSDGRRYAVSQGTRKTAKSIVKVLENGTGHFNINGQSIIYFKEPQEREQLLLPLQICGLVNKVDVICNTTGGGITGQSGSIRYAMSTALQALVEPDTVEGMRLAGLLTLDRRRIERKKPGQKGARAKFTWRKR